MNTKNQSHAACADTAARRSQYQSVQVAGLVAPFVDALNRASNLDAIWVVDFAFEEMAHPARPTLKLSAVIKQAARAAVNECMRVDSLESARSALVRASHYSEWTQRSYGPLLELLEIAIAHERSMRVPSRTAHRSHP